MLIFAKEARAKALEEGISEGRRETARSMIMDGVLPLDKVAEYSGLSLDEVRSLKEETPVYK